MARPKLAGGQARERVLHVRVRAQAYDRLAATAKKRKVTVSEAVRLALAAWVKEEAS